MSATTIRKARTSRPCSGYRCPNTIVPGELYLREAYFPGEEGHEDGVAPRVLAICSVCMDREVSYVATRCRVPARFGGRVVVNGRPGVIVGAPGGDLLVLLDGRRAPVRTHPMWQTEYPTVGVAR